MAIVRLCPGLKGVLEVACANHNKSRVKQINSSSLYWRRARIRYKSILT